MVAGELWGQDNRLLEPYEVRGLAAIYWPVDQVENAFRVTDCESGRWTGAWNYLREDSRGLLQLNVLAHPEMAVYNLFDPQINFYWAYQLWKSQGWFPWTCAHRLGIV
jgi:hypothetical protein